MLNDEQRQEIETRLLEERGETLEALREFDEEFAESLQDRAGELSVYRMHMADLGSESMEREKSFLLASAEGDRLYAIDSALRRLYDRPEKFGVCSECGTEIAYERLLLVPESERCVRCQTEAER